MVFDTAATSTIKLLKDFRPSTKTINEASQLLRSQPSPWLLHFSRAFKPLCWSGNLIQNTPFVRFDNHNEFVSTTKRNLMKSMMLTGVSSTFLSTQYRMHPDINDTISRHFYQGRLVDALHVSGRIEERIFRILLQRHLPSCTGHSVFYFLYFSFISH